MRVFLKILAWLCKIAAILFWSLEALVKIGFDVANSLGSAGLGTPGSFQGTYFEIAIMSALFVLAILPNRWLVFSPIAFVISLLISLIPFYPLLSSMRVLSDLSWMAPLIIFFGLLPLSLILSFWRRRKGEKVGYV